MNAEVYLFGDLGDGYTQYVDDSTRTLFKSIVSMSKANSQLVIHREETLMYYTYVRRLRSAESSNRYIGISYALNNSFVRDSDGLFSIFEGAITTIVARGVILEFTDDGGVTSSLGKIHKAKSEFAQISAYLKNELDSFMVGKNDALPPLDYSVNTTETKIFKYNDSREEILNSISLFPIVYVFKDDDYDTEESKTYSDKLRRLNKENIRLTAENAKIRRQKKRITIVIILVIFLALGLFIILLLAGNSTIKSLQIKSLQKEKATLTQQVKGLQIDTAELHEHLSTAYVNLDTERSHVTCLTLDSTRLTQKILTLKSELNTANQNIAIYIQDINQKERTIRDKDVTIANLQAQLRNAQASANANSSFSVTSIELAGVSKNGKDYTSSFGQTISSKSAYHIKVRIKYVSNINASKFLTIKLYGPAARGNNLVWYQSEVEEVGLSFSSSSKYYNFTKLLYQKGGRIPPGQYKVEVVCDGKIMQTQSFTVSK